MTIQTAAGALRKLASGGNPLLVPLALDPLSARLAEAAGFRALYLGGGTLGYVKTATEANLTLTEMAQTAIEIGAASQLPIVLDAQCGWGDAMHVRRTVQMAEAAGVAALEIEDQLMPKRAHHHIGIEHLIPIEHMVEKIAVAVASRRNADTVIIARTNACRGAGLEEALRRAEAFRQAGADMLLVLPKTPEEALAIGERIDGPLVYMTLGGISSIGATPEELGRLGYRMVIEATTPFYARHLALRNCYDALVNWKPDPLTHDDHQPLTHNVHELIGLEELLAIERRTVEGRPDAIEK